MRQFRLVVMAIAVTAIGGCGSSDASQVAELQSQLDAANERAEAAEAELAELKQSIDQSAATATVAGTETANTPISDESDDPPTDTVETSVDESDGDESDQSMSADETASSATDASPGDSPIATAAEPDESPYVIGFGDLSVIQLAGGEAGKVDIIASTEELDSSGSLPVIVRNNTDKVVGSVEVTGRARIDGELVGSGSSQGLEPAIIEPGEVAWGYVYFDFDGVPSGTAFELSASASPPSDFRIGTPVVEVSNTGSSIVGVVSNDTDDPVSGPLSVSVACFSADGSFVGTADSFTDESEIPAGGTGSFTVDLYDKVCEVGLVGASGWAF